MEPHGNGIALKSKRFSTRIFLLIGGIAGIPLLLFGAITFNSSIRAMKTAAKEGIFQVAKQVAERVNENITTYIQLTEGLAETVQRPFLDKETKETLLNGYTLRFPEIKRAGIISRKNEILISSDSSWTTLDPDASLRIWKTLLGQTKVSGLVRREGFLPTVQLARRLTSGEILLVEISIAHIWRMVDNISVGKTGRALLIDSKGFVIAHASDRGKKYILGQLENHSRADSALYPKPGTVSEYINALSDPVIGAMQVIPILGWQVVVEQDQKEAYAALSSLIILLSALALFLILLVIFLSTRGSRMVARPIETLVQATREVAQGNLTIQVPVTGSDERAQLAEALNKMIKDLEKLHGEIAQKERMSVIGRIASELIHDLRHPVRNIQNAAFLLKSRGDEYEVREMFQRVTQREFQGLNRFLANLEQLISEPQLRFTRVNLNEEITALMESLRATADQKSLKLKFHENRKEIYCTTDRFALQRILQNLLGNAMEATSRGGTVDIDLSQNQEIKITISDSGPGIPKEKLPTLFSALQTTKRRGIGLGLAISKKLIEELGGKIEAGNQKTGGAIFSITLKNKDPNTKHTNT